MQQLFRHGHRGAQLTNTTLTRGGYISNNVFNFGWAARGRIVEGLRGAPDVFAKNFKTIDNFKDNVAYSIKSLDIAGKSYSQGPNHIKIGRAHV
jgi:hypothetical protein